jgi:ribonuclease E
MPNKMLIDASHPEETRVVVLRGNRVEEFDFESADKRQLRGNIYLAKVTRVEPSLQAAFVDYGGNRHGFLAFSEIHPDYYQIPVSDRQELLQEDAAAHRDEEEEGGRARSRRHRRGERAEKRRDHADEKLADAQLAELEDAGNPEPRDAEHAAALETQPTSELLHDSDAVAAVREDAGADESHDTAGEAGAEHHRLATDPEGFAVVEDEQPQAAKADTRRT